jgi:putative intracellular protease/amidase
VLRLREAGLPVTVIGVENDQVAYSLLGYPVVPNVALDKTSPGDFAALVVPGGKLGAVADHPALRRFLSDARGQGVTLAGISQGGELVPADTAGSASGKAIVARTSDDLPKFSRTLLEALRA